jgi:Cell division protein
MRLNKLGYLMSEGFKSVFTHGFMSFASVTIIMACLIIMGSFSLLAMNIDTLIEELEKDNEIIAFIDETMDEEDARALQSQMDATPNVASAVFMSREEAMQNFVDRYGDISMFEGIETDVFRHRYVISLDDITLMQQTQNDLYKIYGVDKVNARLEIAQGFVTVRNIVSAISLVLVIILVVISVFIMANTVKLTTFGRREEIAIMKMVGANNIFIRFPFVVEGLVLGMMGSVIAFFAQWGIYALVAERVMTSIAGELLTMIPFQSVMYIVLAVYLGIGILVGAFGSNIAIRNYLKV